MTRPFDRDDGSELRSAFGRVSRSERRQADLFLADLLAERPPRRRRPTPRPALPVAAPPPTRQAGAAHAAAVFDRFVHGRIGAELAGDEDIESEWEAVAYPSSRTPVDSLQRGDVVVLRALGQGRLAFARVLGEDIEVSSLYEAEGCIREDALILRRRGALDVTPGELLEDVGSMLEQQQVPRTPTAARFTGNAELQQILNDQRELRSTTPPMRGADIGIVQRALVDLGYTLPRFGVDGTYHEETATAVRRFQTEQRLLNPAFLLDGIVGDETLGRLDAIFAALDRPCGAPTAAPTDPTGPAIAQPGRLPYDIGTRTVLGRAMPVRGTIFYPAQAAGSNTPFSTAVAGAAPIVFMAHGEHATFRNPGNPAEQAWSQSPGWIPIPNHDGYAYLQEALARLGIVSVSVDCNATNGTGPTPTNIRLRSGVILESVRHVLLTLAAGGSGSPLSGRVDVARIGLFGHSRGGEAVLVLPEDLAAAGAPLAAVQVRGLLAVAPTDRGTLAVMPAGFPFAVILPAADGDVRRSSGARFYDRIVPAPFKTQLYVHRANHNRFNTEWRNDDPNVVPAGGPALLTGPDHQRLLSVYAAAFFRQALTGVDFNDILLGRTQVAGVSNADIHISAERTGVLTVDDHEDVPVAPATRTTTNALGGATTLQPTVAAVEIPFSQPGVAPNNRFFGATRGMVVGSTDTYRSYRSALPTPIDLNRRDVWIRACEVFGGGVIPTDPTTFQIGLEDVTGEVSFVPAGPLPRPFPRSDAFTKNVPKTFRFGQSCFELARPGVNLHQIRAIHIRLTGAAGRGLGFDQLQVV